MTLPAPYKNSVLGIFTEECDSDTNLTDASFNERVRQETLLKRKTCNSHDYFPFCQFLMKRVRIIDMYLHTYLQPRVTKVEADYGSEFSG